MQIEKQREEYYKSFGTPPGVPTMKGATADPDNPGFITTLSEIWVTTLCPRAGYNTPNATPHRVYLRGHPSNGASPKTQIMPNLAMVMSPQTPPIPKTSSSIIVTISAVRLTSLMPRPISPSSMLICRMENCLWMNTAVARTCRINSMARNSTKKLAYTTMGQGT